MWCSITAKLGEVNTLGKVTVFGTVVGVNQVMFVVTSFSGVRVCTFVEVTVVT